MRGVVMAMVAFLAFLFFGAVAGVAYQVGFTAAGTAAANATAGAATPAYPYLWPGFFFPLGFLFPLLFIFLMFAMVSAAVGRRSGGGYGRHWGGPRMWDEWHRELHERDKAGAVKVEP